MSESSKEKYSFILIVLTAFVIIFPALIWGSGGQDLLFHTVRSEHFSALLWQGQWLPRWAHDMNGGCGSPAAFFHPPFTYYLNSLFAFLKPLSPTGWYPVAATSFVIIVFSGVFCYLWLRDITSPTVARAGAVLYLVMPYLCLTFYHYFTWTEFAAAMWLPLLLYFSRRFALGENTALVGYAFAQAGLLMTNIPAIIVMSPLPVIYFYFHTPRQKIIVNSLRLTLAILFAFALAATFVLPMLMQKQYVYVGHVLSPAWEGKFNYSDNFLFRNPVAIENFITLFLLISAYILWHRLWRGSAGTLKTQATFWFVIHVGSVFMMTSLSAWLWEAIPILQVMQFPRRIMSVSAVSYVAITAYYFLMHKETPKKKESFFWAYLFMYSILFFLAAFPSRWALDSEYTPHTRTGQALGENFNIQRMYYRLNSSFLHESLPVTTDAAWKQQDRIEELAALCAKKTLITSGDATVDVTQWHSRDIELKVAAWENSIITVSQFAYPGWVARDMENPDTVFPITPAPGIGLIRMDIPKGTYKIQLQLEPLWSESWGNRISLIALCLVVMLMAWFRLRQRQQRL